MDFFKKIFLIILICILSLPIFFPLFNNGFISMHDDTQPTRVFEMAKSLKDGQFPVRLVDDLGYGFGYPIFNFYAPLPYYFGAIFIFFGVNAIVATKLMFGFGILISGIFMFLLGNKIWGKYGGIISSILYIYAPYHAVQIYIRGAVGEYWSYGFLPLLGLGLIYLTDKNNINFNKGIIISSLGLALIILSHNIIGFLSVMGIGLIFIVILIKSLFQKKISKLVINLLIIIFFGLGISAFFWLPAVFEAKYTKVESLTTDTNDYHQHFVYFDQLWDSPWGYAGSAIERQDGISFKIGKFHLLLLFLAVFGFIINTLYKKKFYKNYLIIFIIGFGLSVFLLLPISVKIWEIIPLFKYIQYPWRLLVFVLFFLSLICGYLAKSLPFFLNKNVIKILILIISIATIVINLKYFRPQFIVDKKSEEYISIVNMRWQISKISDEYLPKNFTPPACNCNAANTNYRINNDIIIHNEFSKTGLIKLNFTAINDTEITINKAYFPGWKIALDDKIIKPIIIDGLISVPVSSGDHIVTVYFSDTLIRIIANIISLISIIILVKTMFVIQNPRCPSGVKNLI